MRLLLPRDANSPRDLITTWATWSRTWHVLLVVTWCWTRAVQALEDTYVTNAGIESFLKAANAKYGNITHLYSIGNSVQGRPLWVLAIAADSPSIHKPLRTEVKYVANIHGNEVVGRDLLLRLVDLILTSFHSNSTLRHLLTISRLHVLPSLNPDGFQASSQGDCVGVTGRYNANHHDLNRNFPEYFHDPRPPSPRQAETLAVMEWLKRTPFTLSLSFHGGAFVANYPFDNYNCTTKGGRCRKPAAYSESPDDALFRHMALSYASSNARMTMENQCPDAGEFKQGITNGAQWYALPGGMQDYNYIQHGVLELTLEVSCCKYPPASDPPSAYWAENRRSMITFLTYVQYGVHGYVHHKNGSLAPGAHVDVVGKESFVRSAHDGEFTKVLQPGKHRIRASFRDSLMSETLEVEIADTMTEMLTHNFTLDRPYVVSQGDRAASMALMLLNALVIVSLLF